jgi:hypothetical protein
LKLLRGQTVCAFAYEDVVVVVHGASRPADGEWGVMIDLWVQHRPRALVVFTPRSCPGPTAKQRSEVATAWKTIGDHVPMAMITESRVIRGMLTAMQWLTRQPATPYAPNKLEAACHALGIDEAACAALRAEALDMARHLGVEDELSYLSPHSVAV